MQNVRALPIFACFQKFIRPFIISGHENRWWIDLREDIDAAIESMGHRGEIAGANHDIDFARFGNNPPGRFKIGMNIAEE